MDQLDAVRREEGITDVNAVHPSLLVRAGTAGGPTTRRQFKFNILITTFEFIVADANILSRVPFSALVVDEAQRLKNSSSMLLERLSLFHIPRKLLLTGTPIQKSGMLRDGRAGQGFLVSMLLWLTTCVFGGLCFCSAT
jgi:SNF2 family DNA or RNA helicase